MHNTVNVGVSDDSVALAVVDTSCVESAVPARHIQPWHIRYPPSRHDSHDIAYASTPTSGTNTCIRDNYHLSPYHCGAGHAFKVKDVLVFKFS